MIGEGALPAIVEGAHPVVVVTDKEVAMMNAIFAVFPSATYLLCRWHINKNVLAKCKKLLRRKKVGDV